MQKQPKRPLAAKPTPRPRITRHRHSLATECQPACVHFLTPSHHNPHNPSNDPSADALRASQFRRAFHGSDIQPAPLLLTRRVPTVRGSIIAAGFAATVAASVLLGFCLGLRAAVTSPAFAYAGTVLLQPTGY